MVRGSRLRDPAQTSAWFAYGWIFGGSYRPRRSPGGPRRARRPAQRLPPRLTGRQDLRRRPPRRPGLRRHRTHLPYRPCRGRRPPRGWRPYGRVMGAPPSTAPRRRPAVPSRLPVVSSPPRVGLSTSTVLRLRRAPPDRVPGRVGPRYSDGFITAEPEGSSTRRMNEPISPLCTPAAIVNTCGRWEEDPGICDPVKPSGACSSRMRWKSRVRSRKRRDRGNVVPATRQRHRPYGDRCRALRTGTVSAPLSRVPGPPGSRRFAARAHRRPPLRSPIPSQLVHFSA
ncbi:hypothetical protein SUDANB6_01025 [Streptomyces sp. enrichment culture]